MTETTALQATTISTAFELDQELRADARVTHGRRHPVRHEARAAEAGRVEDARHQRAEDAAERVHAEHVERVVRADDLLQARHTPEAHHTGAEADDQRTHDADVTGGRRDRHETRHRTRGGAEHRGLALDDPLGKRPRHHRAGRGEVGVEEGEGGERARFQRRAGVEAEPAEPQHRGADHAQREAVRGHRLLAEADALAEHEARRRGPRHPR